MAYLLGTVLVGIALVVAVTVLRSEPPEQAQADDSVPAGAEPALSEAA